MTTSQINYDNQTHKNHMHTIRTYKSHFESHIESHSTIKSLCNLYESHEMFKNLIKYNNQTCTNHNANRNMSNANLNTYNAKHIERHTMLTVKFELNCTQTPHRTRMPKLDAAN